MNLSDIDWLLVSYSINFLSYVDSRKHRKDPDDPEPADKGDIQIDYSLTNETAKVWEQ